MKRSVQIPVGMLTGTQNLTRHSSTFLTIEDGTAQAYPTVISNQYTIYQPMYGGGRAITDQVIVFEGSNQISNFNKIAGPQRTDLYGPMGTYGYQAILSGFRFATLQFAAPDATYPNMYLALNIGQQKDADGNLVEGILYAEYDVIGDYYHFSTDKSTLPNIDNGINVKEIKYPLLQLSYDNHYIEGLNKDDDYHKILGEDLVKLNINPNTAITETDRIHVPIIGLAYNGRVGYDLFSADFSTLTNQTLQGKYPLFNIDIKDNGTSEFNFNFALTSALNDYGVSQSFETKGIDTCKIVHNADRKNQTQMFVPYAVDRSVANKISKQVENICLKWTDDLLARVRAIYPNFIPDQTPSDWDVVVSIYENVIDLFRKGNVASTEAFETPLSTIDPFDKNMEDLFTNTVIAYQAASTHMKFKGGSYGSIKPILDEEGFSFYHKIPLSNENDTKMVESIVVDPAIPRTGSDFKIIVTLKDIPAGESVFFIDELKKCYSASTDKRYKAIFDPSILPDSICFGEGYPMELQDVVAEFVRYDTVYNGKETSRPDCSYIRTPSADVREYNDAIEWLNAIDTRPNLNMHPVIGTFKFKDPTTGDLSRFSAFYEYLGTGGTLMTYLTDAPLQESFASGTWSEIIHGYPQSEELIPMDANEREELAKRDCMYYGRKDNGNYALWEDSAWAPNIQSDMKSLGTNIFFNRISNITYLYARDNKIKNPNDEDELNILKSNLQKRIEKPAAYFGTNLSISWELSPDPDEAARRVMLIKVVLPGPVLSRNNRVLMRLEPSDNTNSTSSTQNAA